MGAEFGAFFVVYNSNKKREVVIMDSSKLAKITLLGLTIFVVVVIGICTLVEMKNKEPLTDDTKIIKTEEIDSTTEKELEASEHILICNVDNKEIKGDQIELYMWTHDTNKGQKLYIQNKSDYYINIKLCYEDEEDDYFWLENHNYQGTTIAPGDVNLIARNYGFDQEYTFDYIRTSDRARVSQPSKDGGLSTQGYSLRQIHLYIYSGSNEESSHIATVWLSMDDIEIKEVY